MGFDKWSLRDKVVMVWGLIIASVALIFVCVSLGNLISDNSANIASWVQAIGSIAAIFSGFYLVRFQINEGVRIQISRDKESERQSDKKKYFLLVSKATAVASFARTMLQTESRWPGLWETLRAECLETLKDIESISASEYPTSADIVEVGFLILHLKSVLTTLNEDISDEREKLVIFSVLKLNATPLGNYASELKDYFMNQLGTISTPEERDFELKAILSAVTRMQKYQPVMLKKD